MPCGLTVFQPEISRHLNSVYLNLAYPVSMGETNEQLCGLAKRGVLGELRTAAQLGLLSSISTVRAKSSFFLSSIILLP